MSRGYHGSGATAVAADARRVGHGKALRGEGYALNGSTGDVLLRVAASHATWTEFISVADIDGDKSADLLFSTKDHWNGAMASWAVCGYAGTDAPSHGVFVHSDPDKAWMSTRRV